MKQLGEAGVPLCCHDPLAGPGSAFSTSTSTLPQGAPAPALAQPGDAQTEPQLAHRRGCGRTKGEGCGLLVGDPNRQGQGASGRWMDCHILSALSGLSFPRTDFLMYSSHHCFIFSSSVNPDFVGPCIYVVAVS